MNPLLERSREIVFEAIANYKPYAVVAMMSGGKDSMLAYQVARQMGIQINFIMHGNTRTGIAQTTDFVRQFAQGENARYIEADAGDAYENYVLRKGFFGRGRQAHSFAYHTLKQKPFASAISRHIRQGQRGRTVLFLNGARSQATIGRAWDTICAAVMNTSSCAKRGGGDFQKTWNLCQMCLMFCGLAMPKRARSPRTASPIRQPNLWL